jgi:5-hydroxyisourate hydrolase
LETVKLSKLERIASCFALSTIFERQECFYPEVVALFLVRDSSANYHIPLLLSPYGYTTYRGS